ncbi:unnamed protein product [Phytophthora fragariaefolia]|uniref:Unnamed protein product n=1 Tax=Phytophthora fragariaefolia TaxID=1490495 RepID=A0A9W6XJ38_9STRA|nr:unnamed protein product [Phytophthora fragariaefolia]
MTTRNTARDVLRSDTAPDRRILELENGDREESAAGATNRSRTGSAQRLDQLETGLSDLRQELTAAHDSMRIEVTAEWTNLAVAESAQQIAADARNQTHFQQNTPAVRLTRLNPLTAQNQEQRQSHREHLAEAAAMNNVAMTEHEEPDSPMPIQNQVVMPSLRKMDVSPPLFEGLIDGNKLNSFIFQFESYFQQKGYSLTTHDHLLPLELNQCVRKNALIWYERYMTDSMTSKLWSVMKGEIIREFREPNFHAKIRNQLLKLKQIGAYHGFWGRTAASINREWDVKLVRPPEVEHSGGQDKALVDHVCDLAGATMDGVTPEFCSANGLGENVVDHHEPMEITLAAKQTMIVPTKNGAADCIYARLSAVHKRFPRDRCPGGSRLTAWYAVAQSNKS